MNRPKIPLEQIYSSNFDHFEMVAEQRLKTFNFYFILLAASVGASLTALEKRLDTYTLIICGSFCLLVSLAFFCVELKGKKLLSIPTKTLSRIEIAESWPEHYRIFGPIENLRWWWRWLFSYTAAFRLTMGIHFIFGLFVIWCPLSKSDYRQKSNTKETTQSEKELVLQYEPRTHGEIENGFKRNIEAIKLIP